MFQAKQNLMKFKKKKKRKRNFFWWRILHIEVDKKTISIDVFPPVHGNNYGSNNKIHLKSEEIILKDFFTVLIVDLKINH